jgi:V/A-type H+-transporting ATPase subunit I
VEIDAIAQGEDEDLGQLVGQYDNGKTLEDIEAKISEIKFALDFITRYKVIKKGAFAPKHAISLSEVDKVIKNADGILQVAATCRKLQQELVDLSARETRVVTLKQQMLPWEGLSMPLEDIGETKKVNVLIGTVGKSSFADFEDAIAQEFGMREFFIRRVGEDGEQAYYLLIYHKCLKQDVEPRLKEYGFNHASFKNVEGTPTEVLKKYDDELYIIESERQRIQQQAEYLGQHVRDLEILYDALSVQRDKEREALKLLKTERTFVLKGWIPKSEAKRFSDRLSREVGAVYVYFEDPKPDENFPVAYENASFVQPFEVVTELYSTPNPRSIDPSPFIAPFFFVFFGIMMGDAGYGLVISAISYIAMRKLKLTGILNKLVRLIFLGGISTFLWGIVFGGWFGNAGEALGLPALWFDPVSQPLNMLIFCFALGLVHIFVGMGIKAYMSIKRGRLWDAVFDQGLWYITIIGLVLMATYSQTVGMYMTIVGAIGLVLTQGRHQRNIIKRLFSGIMSLYNITGYFSDVLSYSRLFALGLATGVIGTVFNQLGLMAATSWIGWVLAAVILVVGHMFNILINILGTYVHSSRLQYIEFFGRFFEAGGRAFKPLRIKTKFIHIYQEEEAV